MLKFSFDFNLFNNSYFFYEKLEVLLFSLIPTMLLIGFVLYSDKRSKEPFKNIIICLLSGILTIALSMYFENLTGSWITNSTVLTYLWAFIEEASKIAIFLLFIYDNKYFDDIYDGIVYMSLIALSFAGLENIMYAFSESTVPDSISLALIRDFTTIPLHVICGVVIGYFMSLSSFSKEKKYKIKNIILAIIIPGLMHGTYNFVMSILKNYDNKLEVLLKETLPIVLVMIVLFYIAFKVIEKALNLNEIYLKNEKYENKYKYLMNKNEYYNSNVLQKRIKINNFIRFK